MDSEIRLSNVRQRALAFANSTDLDNHFGTTLVNAWVSDGQMQMVGEQGLEKTWTTTTVIGQRNYDLPRDFIAARLVLYDGYTIEAVQQKRIDFKSTGNSYVDRYYIWGAPYNQILLGPQPPSAATTLEVHYFGEPRILGADDEVPEVPRRFRMYLAHYAAAQMCRVDGDLQGSTDHMNEFARGVQQYQRWRMYGGRNNFRTVLQEADY